MLRLTVKDQTLTRQDDTKVVTNSVNYLRASVTFLSTGWDKDNAYAIIETDTDVYKAGFSLDNFIHIPAAALTQAGKIYISLVYKTDDIQITTSRIGIDVAESGATDGLTPDTPTLTTDNVDQIYANTSAIGANSIAIAQADSLAVKSINGKTPVENAITLTAEDVGAAIKNHASTDTTYGSGTDSNYGHVKLSDSTSSTSSTSDGVAATPAAVKVVKDATDTNSGSITAIQASLSTKETVDIITAKSNFTEYMRDGKYISGTGMYQIYLRGVVTLPAVNTTLSIATSSITPAVNVPLCVISADSTFICFGFLTSTGDIQIGTTTDAKANTSQHIVITGEFTI